MRPQTLVLEFPKLKKTRRYGAKVRTGCLTCKTRRIKCDEAKPACLRCTSTGRNCDGYAKYQMMHPKRQLGAPSPLLDTIVNLSWPEDGVLYLDFYYHCAIRNLSNHFDNGFWSRTALQMARSEPSIRHAIIALGYLAKTEPGDLKHAHARLARQDKTLDYHYSKAVRLLVERIAEESWIVEVGLVACLLFVCIEFLRGNPDNAFTHFHSGLKIISELPFQAHGLQLRSPSPASRHVNTAKYTGSSGLLEDTLIPMFTRNITPAMLFGASIEQILDIPIPDPTSFDTPFSTFHELQMASFQLRNASALFARTMSMKIFVKAPLTWEDFEKRLQLLRSHQAWLKALQKLEKAKVLSQEETIMAASLKLGYYSSYILIHCAMDLRQTSFDAHLDYFKAINHNARIVLDSMGVSTPSLPASCSGSSSKATGAVGVRRTGARFTFEISVIPPLHFVATRCRCPITRREALALLETHPPREGLWDPETHIAVAKRVIEIEEATMDPVTGWPSEASRLWCSVVDGKGYLDGKILVTFAFAEWARNRVPQDVDMRPVGGAADRADAQWVESIS